MSAEREALDRAYRQAIYRILLDGAAIERRIGRADPAADERLRREAGCRAGWALVTAWNPYSLPCGETLNRQRQSALQDQLDRLGQRHLPALHRSPSGDWPDEESFLLLDPPPQRAETLGRLFGQNTIVRAALGQPPELVWLHREAEPGPG